MISINRPFFAYLDDMHMMTILLPFDYKGGNCSSFSLLTDRQQPFSKVTIIKRIPLETSVKYVCQIDNKPIIGHSYWVEDEYGEKTDLQIGAVIRTEEFDQAFFYGGPLGASYSNKKTIFKLWAPTAIKVRLKLTAQGSDVSEILEMERGEKGVWQLTVQQDLEFYRYSFLLCINLEWRESVDPYANAVSINGEYGVIIDLQKTKTIKPDLPPLTQPTDAIIYETHIRDLTIHPQSGAVQKGTYLGVAELNTKSKEGGWTGLTYIKDLGITHIEFLPFNDFEGVDERKLKEEYNWGYNPLHFNVPDGSYSTNPTDPYARINELKKMICTIQSQGLRVIMDVVYNHVYRRETSTFEKIVPGYFFRHDEYGMPSNGTGVGNDFASERLMARKFILDSVKFWLSEYQIDGFRFDLMGILDVETMLQIRKAADDIDPSIIMIGEGWDLNTPMPAHSKANISNQSKLPRIGQFNDWFRDTIKGSTFNLYDRGYALGNTHYFEAAKQVIAGSVGLGGKERGLFGSPVQSVNYVESHDNHTLWDKLSVCSAEYDSSLLQRFHRLATSMVLLAQGIPFLHSGQEFFRTKNGIGNSYRSPDEVNYLDWDRKKRFEDNVNYIKGLIQIRKSHRAFRFSDAALIRKHFHYLPLESPIIGFVLEDVEEYGEWSRIVVLFNPKQCQHIVSIPKGNWHMFADEIRAGVDPIKRIMEPSIVIQPISTYILAE